MGARLIEVREYPEFAEGHIEGSELVPLGTLDKASEGWDRSEPLTLVCRSGRRAEVARQTLAGRDSLHSRCSTVECRRGRTAASLGAGLVGAGLVYAGVSDNCMMASVLGRMPWNNPEKAKA